MMFVWLALGMILAAVAALAPLRWAGAVVLVCLPLSGTAVLILGSDPILLPLVVSLGFIARHAFSLLQAPQRAQFIELLRSDAWLLAFLGYCAVSAILFPRFFDGATNVYPQVYSATPVSLGPNLISYVQLAYLVIAIWTTLALRQAMLRAGLEWVVMAILTQAGLIAGIGVIQSVVGLAGKPLPLDWIVNNTAYAVMTQAFTGGFVRITSVFVESSSFAMWACGILAFCYALYTSKILPRVTLTLCAVLAGAMALSTSSTAYFGMAWIGFCAFVHILIDTDRGRRSRGLVVVLLGGVMVAVMALLLATVSGGALAQLRGVIEDMTFNKASSGSGVERGAWVAQSLQNMRETGLLGTGYGSARSSGLFFVVLGTVGVPGMVLFLLALAPRVRRSLRRVRTGEDAVSAAGAFGLIGALGAMAASGADLSLANMFWAFMALSAAPLAQRAARRAAALPPEN